MTLAAILIDVAALILMLVGGLLVLRQRQVRRWWRAAGSRPARAPRASDGEDPAHYAMIIFGMMIFAFGLIILVFNTTLHLIT